MIDGNDFGETIPESELSNPAFIMHVRREFSNKYILPDEQDFDASADVSTSMQAKAEYRKAQARKLVRLYRSWKAAQN
jgi:hypothetical protein